MTCSTGRRWPLAPLLSYLRLTRGGFARRYGLSPRAVYEAHRFGLTDDEADDWTIAADLHPCLIWPEWLTAYDDADEDLGEAA